MFRYYFNSNIEIVITNDNDMTIIQNTNPNTQKAFNNKDEAIQWATEYVTSLGETLLSNLDVCKSKKKEEISQWCRDAINIGFESTAYQGINKLYGATIEDQMNIQGNIIAAGSKLNGTPGCENDKFYYHAKDEDFVEWTETECLQLGRDLKQFVQYNLFKSKTLQNYVDTLITEEEVELIVSWDTEIPNKGEQTDEI